MVFIENLIHGILRDSILVLIAGFFVGFLAGRHTMRRSMMVEKREIADVIDLALNAPAIIDD